MSFWRKIFRKHKLSNAEIVFLGVLGAAVVAASRLSLRVEKVGDYEVKLRAARAAAEAFKAIKEARLNRGYPIDPVDDPGESGLIGLRESPITTTVGDYESKLTSVNPNWAAAVVDFLRKAGVRPGDKVALFMTGSFPALNAATIVAVEQYGAVPVWTCSVGASSWGANIPGFTWLDMEKVLRERGLIKGKCLGASLGGNNGVGAGLPEESRKLLREVILRNGVPLLDTLPLQALVNLHYNLLLKAAGDRPKLFINIGGGAIGLGTSEAAHLLEPGLNPPKSYLLLEDQPVEGLAALFLKNGVQVLHLHNINTIAKEVGLPIAPAAVPDPGVGPLFFQPKYPISVNAALLVGYLVILALTLGGFLGRFFGNPRKEEEMV